jgi:hypothetical protein
LLRIASVSVRQIIGSLLRRLPSHGYQVNVVAFTIAGKKTKYIRKSGGVPQI